MSAVSLLFVYGRLKHTSLNCVNVCEDAAGRGGRAAAAAANKRGPAAGAVGLSFEKMQLVRQKKEEIEKVSVYQCVMMHFIYR